MLPVPVFSLCFEPGGRGQVGDTPGHGLMAIRGVARVGGSPTVAGQGAVPRAAVSPGSGYL